MNALGRGLYGCDRTQGQAERTQCQLRQVEPTDGRGSAVNQSYNLTASVGLFLEVWFVSGYISYVGFKWANSEDWKLKANDQSFNRRQYI